MTGKPPFCKVIKLDIPDIVIKPKNPKYDDFPQKPSKPTGPRGDGPSNNPNFKQKAPGLQFNNPQIQFKKVN